MMLFEVARQVVTLCEGLPAGATSTHGQIQSRFIMKKSMAAVISHGCVKAILGLAVGFSHLVVDGGSMVGLVMKLKTRFGGVGLVADVADKEALSGGDLLQLHLGIWPVSLRREQSNLPQDDAVVLALVVLTTVVTWFVVGARFGQLTHQRTMTPPTVGMVTAPMTEQ